MARHLLACVYFIQTALSHADRSNAPNLESDENPHQRRVIRAGKDAMASVWLTLSHTYPTQYSQDLLLQVPESVEHHQENIELPASC